MANYIATREGVEPVSRGNLAGYVGERIGSAGLFSDEGVPINLSQIEREMNDHKGNIWGLIFSLKREDAERLGYHSPDEWMNLLRSRRNDIAKEMRIAPENLVWYAAFHQKDSHPHVHMLVWSKNPSEPFLSRTGIHNIKKEIAGDIFRDDLLSVYKEQTEKRDELRAYFRERMAGIAEEIRAASDLGMPELEMKFVQLSEKLKRTKGKKQYGYLDKTARKTVDEIVKMVSEDERIDELYDLWYKLKCETYRTYTDAMPEKLPLWEEKEFKPIRNAAVKIASDFELDDDENVSEGGEIFVVREYTIATKILRQHDPDLEEAEYYLIEGADKGCGKCAYNLWKFYSDGTFPTRQKNDADYYLRLSSDLGYAPGQVRFGKELLEKNREMAKNLFENAYSQGNIQAAYLLGKMLLEDGDTDKALDYLCEASEQSDLYKYRYALLCYHKFGDKELCNELLTELSNVGYAPAKKALQVIRNGRNMQIVSGIANLFAYAGNLFIRKTPVFDEDDDIDKELRNEIRQVKNGEPVLSM